MNDHIALLQRDHPDKDHDRYVVQDNIESGLDRVAANVPEHYSDATADVPEIIAWVQELVALAAQSSRPVVRTGPSLLILGTTGTGKTYQAYGAMRALSTSGVACRWAFATAAEIYARLRPRHGVDSEAEFRHFARSPLLVIDDLGAAKASDWTEEVNYRLVNYRYEHVLPTLITSNVPTRELRSVIGERVASRLVEMCQRVVLQGTDRRRVPMTATETTTPRKEAR